MMIWPPESNLYRKESNRLRIPISFECPPVLPRGRAWLKLRYRDATMIKILRLSGPGMMSSANARVGRGSNAF